MGCDTYERAFKVDNRNRIYIIRKVIFTREMRIESVSFFILGGTYFVAIRLNRFASKCKGNVDILARK